MQEISLGHIEKLIVHFVGNKNNSDGVRFSNILSEFGEVKEDIQSLIKKSFKFDELFQFYFEPSLELNPTFQFISSIFNDETSFIEHSQNSARYLYDKSNHPQIKGGELSFVFLSNCVVNGETTDAIALIKSETKDTFLKFNTVPNGYSLNSVKGINIKKIDKGCLIFNTQKENGYVVAAIDNTNKNLEAQYWKDEFLHIRSINDEYNQTNNFLGITKQFLTKELPEDISKSEQIDLLNRSVEYFKANESFSKDDFEETVLGDNNIIESFRNFDEEYREEHDIELSDNFSISPKAVKKQARAFKRVLKLDENFDIYIKGNKELIEKGIDENGRKFYKIYYDKEK